jgi:predicted ABC-class ATPase
VDRLPLGRDTRCFSTEDASGSTSQAASIIEAVQSGARVLLMDEDTSATNLMVRDRRMQMLVARDKEPITPLLYRIRELYETHGVSSIVVMGASGDYFDVADTVIMMDNYGAEDMTARARALADPSRPGLTEPAPPPFPIQASRHPVGRTVDASRGRREHRIEARGPGTLLYGEQSMDLSQLVQLVDAGQTRAIGWLIRHYAERYADTTGGLTPGLRQALEDVAREGLDVLCPHKVGNLALPRLQEVAATLNRMRTIDWSDAAG